MNDSTNPNKLLQLCQQLQDEYLSVESLIKEVKEDRNGDLDLESLTLIRNRLNEIKQIEEEFAPLRDDVMATGQTHSGIRDMVASTIKVITRLIPDISQIEKLARDSRAKLGPKIHDSVRGLQMQNAYHRVTTS